MIFPRIRNNDNRTSVGAFSFRAAYACTIVVAVVLATGCEIVERIKTDLQSAPSLLPRSAAQTALAEGIELYEKGEYNSAIKHLSGSPDIWTADRGTQTKALKYMAFSYCVTSRQLLCRQQFEKAFKLDSSFDLEPGEKGHPLWGRAFEIAKKAK